MALTITSPGIQINEVDLSQRTVFPSGTNILFCGFAAEGPTDEIIQVSSTQEYEELFGQPTTAAERYAYHTFTALANSPAAIYFSRLPYGAGTGEGTSDEYSALVYPVIPAYSDGLSALTGTPLTTQVDSITSGTAQLSSASGYFLMQPIHITLSQDEYTQILNSEQTFSWKSVGGGNFSSWSSANLSDLGSAGMIVLNHSKRTLNEKFEGYYLGVSDTANINPATNYTDIKGIKSVNLRYNNSGEYVTIDSNRLNFALTGKSDKDTSSVSNIIERIPKFNLASNVASQVSSTTIGGKYSDTLIFGLFKLTTTHNSPTTIALDAALSEKYVGSFCKERTIQNPNGGSPTSFFIGTVDDTSPNIDILVNPYISQNIVLTENGRPNKMVQVFKTNTISDYINESSEIASLAQSASLAYSNYARVLSSLGSYPVPADNLYPVGNYKSTSNTADKVIGSVPEKIDRVLTLVENPDFYKIDLTIEAGLGTVFASTNELSSANYDETAVWPSLSGMEWDKEGDLPDSRTRDNYMAVFNVFEQFASRQRKDHMFIADPIRQIFIRGQDTNVLKQTYGTQGKKKYFSKHIYHPLRNQFSLINTSYAATYAQWVKVFDNKSSAQVWVPYSGFIASLMANNDARLFPWTATAGYNYGVNSGFNNIAFYSKQSERDALYKLGINNVFWTPDAGVLTFSEQTLLKNPSSFEKIHIRRLFLWLEKATRQTAKAFLFEPNTIFTRTRVVNMLDPIFSYAKNNSGVYDYLLICNEKNNSATDIDNGVLNINIYVKAVRTAEFINITFYSTRTDFDFSEVQ